jgi:hypothetical protein
MTEAEWLACEACEAPQLQLQYLSRNSTERKLRLFLCGCARTVWQYLTLEGTKRVVEVGELLADGLATEEAMSEAKEAIPGEFSDEETRTAWYAAAWIAVHTTDRFVNPFAPERTAPENGCQVAEMVIDALTQPGVLPGDPSRYSLLIRCIFGNPFRPIAVDPAWRSGNVMAIAQSIYDERAFDRMPILADALEDAGCTNADVLNHCRQPGEHVRGCWVVDLILGKE